MPPMFLPDVEQHPQPCAYTDAIRAMQTAGSEYPQIWHMFAYLPRATEHLARFTQEILREPGPLSPGIRELIAAYTSSRNQCPFWLESHAAVAAVLLQEERGIDGRSFVVGVMRNVDTSTLSDPEKILFRFVEKVNHSSNQITADDMRPLRAAGWSDTTIYYAITVCALFNFYNRWIDASGVHVLSEESHRAGGIRSSKTGYIRR